MRKSLDTLLSCSLAKSHPTLCSPVECNLMGSSVRGILQARILEWVAMPSSRGSSWSRDQIYIVCISCIGRQIFFFFLPLGHLRSPLNLCTADSNSYFHLNCDFPGTKAFVFHWKNFYFKKSIPFVSKTECNYFTGWNLDHDYIYLFKYGKYLAHRICGILVSRDMWNWTGPGPQKDDCCVGKGMDGMTWKVYSSSNFDDVILTRWGQWRIRRLLMLPLCFSSWVYSSGNCIFSLAWALRLWCTAYASQKPFVSHMKQAAKGSWRNSANQLSASTFSFSSGNPRSFTDYSF